MSRSAGDLIDDGLARLVREAGARYRDLTLDTFPTHHSAQVAALAAARRFASGSGSGFGVTGPSGRGKTGLVKALSHELIQAHPGLRLHWLVMRDWLARLRLEIAAGDTPDVTGYAVADVLVVDDLGAERPSDWAVEAIGALVDAAYREAVHTLFTSNYRPAALAERLSTDNDPQAGARIVSRLVDDGIVVELPDDAPDLRLPPRLTVMNIEGNDA
jgi:DNA replication protein DnaC